MADCSYARCVQERRFIKRELQKWTKSMVYIVGLERVAEELMGRRKWKLYQDVLTSSTHHQPHYQQSQQQQQLSPTDHHQANTASATAAQPDTNLAVNNISTAVDLDCVPTAKNNGQLLGHLKGNLDKVGALSDKEEAQPPAAHCIKIDKEIKIENEAIESPPSAKEDNLKKNGEENPNSHNLNHPVDWKPQDKCYFCVDGKLLAVNDRGELVPESGSGNTEPELLTTTPIDSDSDSSESEIGNPNLPNATSRAVKELLRNPNMTSLESVMAQYAAVASMHGLPAMPGLAPFYPGLWYSPFTQNLQDNAESSSSTNQKQSTNSDNASPVPNAEQPLDLSAKSSSSSSSSLDQKNIFKAKPRMTAISGRRTYTEDELQNALQDILSGKLGTRRAAVLYGIPRSTLRNKVYKLAMEQKREANINPILVAPVLNDLDEDDKESGAEDEKELEKTLHGLPSEDILRITATQSLALQNIGKYYQNHNQDGPSDMATPPPKQSPIPSKSQTPTLQNPLLDPNMFSLLLSGSLGALSGLGAKSDETPPAAAMAELFRNFLLQHELLKSSEVGRVVKSETPETASLESTGRSGSDVNDTNDDPSVILKIPSFKPIVGPSGVSLPGAPSSLSTAINNNKNGDTAPNSQPTATTPVLSRSPHQSQQHSLLGMPSPNLHPSSDSQSPPIPNLGKVSIRDVIAQSISKNFQPNLMEPVKKKHPQPESGPSMLDYYKTYPSISVKKDLGAEMNRFGSGSSLLGGSSVMNASLNNTGTGGKGTRPKRGKYRNYDRDSLVEAVRAVQRGEMSVHRAGSYYGVPHSTLEYKVKERHLMRPRKREPKPQPVDDRGTNSSSSPVTNTKSSDIPSSSNAVRSALDKGKLVSPASAKPPLKTPPFSSTSSPNGMKMPFVDPAMAAQLQYSPHLFWPHPPNFSGMPMDFARTSGSSSSTTFPPNTPDTFFASQMMQRFQEEGAHRKTNSTNSTSSHNSNSMAKLAGNSINNSGKPGQQLSNSFVPKSARELAESLYDGTNVNGSFLDGIIRHSLDRKPGDIPQGALLDQLVKSNLPLSSKLLGDEGSKTSMLGSVGSLKRGASPMNFPTEIKRERDSPPSEPSLVAQPVLGLNSRKRGSEGNDNGPLVDSLLKLREGLQERPTEDFNGSNNKEVDQKPKNLLMASDNDNEDSS